MKPGLKGDSRPWSDFVNSIFIGLLFCCLFAYAESRWCSRVESYQTVRTIVVPSKCNQSYEESCGWFTSEQCVRYELVECVLKKNHTILRYRMLTECCRGFKLNPINNFTCIEDEGPPATTSSEKSSMVPKKVGFSSQTTENIEGENGEKDLAITTATITSNDVKDHTKEGKPTRHEKNDHIFLNLSSGAYTGIICAFVFLFCILILIGMHFWKKQRRLKEKVALEIVKMDVTQKMLSAQV